LWYLAPFFLLASQSSFRKKTFYSNIIKNSSDKAQSLLHIIKQVQDTLHSQRYDHTLSCISFRVWGLILRSLIHFELILV
jgi:hypothetical protein